MSSITMKGFDVGGNAVEFRYEAPQDEQGRTAVAYMRPSGKTYVNPLYAIGSRRDGHLGVDGKGNEFVSDQYWVYDMQDAARLERAEPDRFVRVGA